MPYLQKLLAGLMLFAPATYALASGDQAALGKIRGFTGPMDVNPEYVSLVLQGSVHRFGRTALTPNL